MGTGMRRAAVVGAVAAFGAVVQVPAASAAADSVGGSCRAEGFTGHATLVYNKVGDTYRPVGVTLTTGPHLGESEPLSARAQMRISHVVHSVETVDFDRTRTGLRTGVTVTQQVDSIEVPATAAMKVTVIFTFGKRGGGNVVCRVDREV